MLRGAPRYYAIMRYCSIGSKHLAINALITSNILAAKTGGRVNFEQIVVGATKIGMMMGRACACRWAVVGKGNNRLASIAQQGYILEDE